MDTPLLRLACSWLVAMWLATDAGYSLAGDWHALPADRAHSGLTLRAWWSVPPALAAADSLTLPGGGSRPAVLMLHGCGGMLNRRGEPSARMVSYARLLNAQGWHTVALDSLTPRGEQEICTQRTGSRRVTMTQRRADALAALKWMAVQPSVDPRRLAVLGWSNGGSAVLASTNLLHPDVLGAREELNLQGAQLALAVAFYPGCATEARRGYQPWSPTHLLLGLSDDWTPANECVPLASERVLIHSWEGAHHGFDGTADVVHRKDVPNGVHPGQGVHVGGHPQAREESQAVLLNALREAFAR